MKFSLIIPTLNEEKRLPLLLSDLAAQTNQDFDLIIVDGHSQDQTVKNAQAFNNLLNLQVINSPKRNVSYQRNLGAKTASSDFLLFIDADNRLSATFISDLKKQLSPHSPHIFSTLIQPETNRLLHSLAANSINFHMLLLRHTNSPFVIEALMGFTKAIFHDLGGFDPNLPNGEGSDLLNRARAKGYQFTLLSQPRYTFSLRRLEKIGLIRQTMNVAQLEIARLLGQKITPQKAQQLYPMKGGKFFD